MFIDAFVSVREAEPFKIDGKRVYDPRKLDPYTPPVPSAALIVAHHEAVQDGQLVEQRESSPARSDAPSIVSNASVQMPEDLIIYPPDMDGKGLLVNIDNPLLSGWLPVNPSQDYRVETLPATGAKVVTSESLGILKYVAQLYLRQDRMGKSCAIMASFSSDLFRAYGAMGPHHFNGFLESVRSPYNFMYLKCLKELLEGLRPLLYKPYKPFNFRPPHGLAGDPLKPL